MCVNLHTTLPSLIQRTSKTSKILFENSSTLSLFTMILVTSKLFCALISSFKNEHLLLFIFTVRNEVAKQTPPCGADTPREQTPLGADTPRSRHPLEADTPPGADQTHTPSPPLPGETATHADGTNPIGMHSCLYNVINTLVLKLFHKISRQQKHHKNLLFLHTYFSLSYTEW